MNPRITRSTASLLIVLTSSTLLAHRRHPAIKPEQAKDCVGKDCAIELEVKSSRLLKDKHICFLNSMKDYRDEKNFTVVIRGEVLQRFLKSGKDPAKHYFGKKLRVEGKVTLHRERPQIVIEKITQIEMVKSAD